MNESAAERAVQRAAQRLKRCQTDVDEAIGAGCKRCLARAQTKRDRAYDIYYDARDALRAEQRAKRGERHE